MIHHNLYPTVDALFPPCLKIDLFPPPPTPFPPPPTPLPASAAFARLTSLEAFTAQPELVEEFFFLLSRFLEYCPALLLASPLMGGVLQCGVVGLQVGGDDLVFFIYFFTNSFPFERDKQKLPIFFKFQIFNFDRLINTKPFLNSAATFSPWHSTFAITTTTTFTVTLNNEQQQHQVDHRAAHAGIVSTFYYTVAAGSKGPHAPAVTALLAQWGALVVIRIISIVIISSFSPCVLLSSFLYSWI
jgi:hypothetical protein